MSVKKKSVNIKLKECEYKIIKKAVVIRDKIQNLIWFG